MSDSASDLDEKSLGRLVLGLAWQLLLLVGPIVAVTLLPPWQGVIIILACGAVTAVCVKLKWMKAAGLLTQLTSSAVIGLAFSLGRTLPNYWNVPAALVVLFGGLAVIGKCEHWLGLAVEPVKPKPQLRDPVDDRGDRASAWGGNEPQETPEGEPIRVFNHSEIAMGGPTYCDYLFPDGVLLQGVGSSARFSSDGRYFAAAMPSRNHWGLLILDRELKQIYHCNTELFWELDQFTETHLIGRCSPLVDNGTYEIELKELLESTTAVKLVPIADIWIEPSEWLSDMTGARCEYPAPTGRHKVEGRLSVPESLRNLEQPTNALRYPYYQLSLDGEDTALQFYVTWPPIWRADGNALCVWARKAGEQLLSYWYWEAGSGWTGLPEPWVKTDNEPSLNWSEPLSLDDQYVRITGYLDYPKPDRGTYGYGLQSVHSDTETQIGHDAQGRMLTASRPLTRTQLMVPLAGSGERGSTQIETEMLLNAVRARLIWQRDNAEGLGGFICMIGDWALPGLWLMDHRVSDCRRYLALIPFTPSPAVANHVVVADSERRCLLDGPPMQVVRLLDFQAGRLSVATVLGRLSKNRPTSPLQRLNQQVPPAEVAAGFCEHREDSKPYYEAKELAIESGELRLRPKWRRVTVPQVANADGDFIQPAPSGNDAAWLFGSETEYADSWLRGSSGRLGGHLLTASGCALKGLAPSMIWSADGRYLALTRMHADMQRSWELLLLDVQDRTLRTYPHPLGNMPLFEAFDNERLHVRTFEEDWEPRDNEDQGRVSRLRLAELLALPAEQMVEHDGLWLLTAQQDDADLWKALDIRPLNNF
ncbi:hypothetical protein [Pseudomonas sp. v388]|uniref:hypothetical protein n=1 Tax=Pseudomonas sp. v388 TaxID=2479849 RepID=UPI002115792B|nr:hypothetical protein [Pseudomonas sp. v388]